MQLLILAALFLLTAFAYAAVGFGGGSTYNALLVLSDVDYREIPAIALTCNILVVSGGVYHFRAMGQLQWRELLPFVALSVPMAWLGGRIPVPEQTFVGLLGLTLLVSGVLMLAQGSRHPSRLPHLYLTRWQMGLPLGAGIGLLSGIVGIGGGIFLAPLLYLFGAVPPRRIAGLASGFILLNSVAGLAGQLMKQAAELPSVAWSRAWPLYLAVVVGGQAGSRLGARMLTEQTIRRLTGVLVLYVALRLLLRWRELGAV
ncbi:MAG TPA: sulfite exporter TauE/SafE family protein [Xanthomonadales bacterium]|nr:sulfite exporter TauE/SafE family protein [Xanthomonadales bacterium]